MPKPRGSRSPEAGAEPLRAAVEEFDRSLRALTPRTPVSFGLLGASGIVFLLMAISAGGGLVAAFSDATLADWGANQPALTADKQGWRLLTAIFVHFWLLQLLFNGWTLLDLGRFMERLLGGAGLLLVYLAAGFAGNLAQVVWQPAQLVTGSTGAIFGLLGALAGLLIRDRRAIPAAVTARLRKSVPAFLAFNVGYGLILERLDAANYLGAVAAGLACGLIMARPLTAAGVANRWRGNLVVAALSAAMVVAAAMIVSPPPADLKAEFDRLVELESQLTSIYEAGRADQRVPERRFADLIDDEIIRPWRAERARLESLGRVAPADQPAWRILKDYVRLREQSWTLLAQAVRSGDKEMLEEAKQKSSEADRVADKLAAEKPAAEKPAAEKATVREP